MRCPRPVSARIFNTSWIRLGLERGKLPNPLLYRLSYVGADFLVILALLNVNATVFETIAVPLGVLAVISC